MNLIHAEYCDTVAILTLNRGITNAINLQIVNELGKRLQEIKDDTDVNSVVLGSSNTKFFSIGFDIPHLFQIEKENFQVFYQTFNQVCLTIFTLPKPTIAALTGHAIAGGCILALCCDYRFIADGRKLMGVNEIKLGVPVPYPGDCILRYTVGTRNARDIMDTGEFYQSKELLQRGIVDQVLPLEEVLPKAIKKAHLLGSLSDKAFEMIKRNRVERVEAQIQKHLREKEQYFIERWYSKETRELLKKAIKKFQRKQKK